jgi:hypothetical protein
MCHETLETYQLCSCRRQTIKLCSAFLHGATDEGLGETKRVYLEGCMKREGIRKRKEGACGGERCIGAGNWWGHGEEQSGDADADEDVLW